MQVKGLLLSVRRYSFKDKENGNQVEGGKITLAIPSDKSDTQGYLTQDIPCDYAQFNNFAAQANSLYVKPVVVDCDITLSGRYTKLKATNLKAA